MNDLQPESTLADLNRISGYDSSLLREVNHVFRRNGFFAADAATALVAISGLGRTISRRLQGQDVPVRRTFSGDGVCAVDVSGEPARYRSLSPSHGTQALSHGDSQHGFSEQPVQRERKP